MATALATALMDLKRDEVLDTVKQRVGAGEDPRVVLKECQEGMTLVGQRFQEGEFFLSELLLSGEIFKEVAASLKEPLAAGRAPEALGVVVLATLRGDVHDLGKNILATLLEAQGFEVYDLGVDVDPEVLVAKVKEVDADFVGYSALVTTAFPTMKEATDALVEAGLRDGLKIMIGGGVTTDTVRVYAGADFQTLDACDGVDYCLRLTTQKAEVV